MKTVIEMAIEAGVSGVDIACFGHYPFDLDQLKRFADIIREDEREKQQRHKVTLACPICAGTLMDDEQPFSALASRQMRDSAVKVCDELYKHDRKESGYDEGWNDGLDRAEQAIAALPVPEVQWRDLTDDDMYELEKFWRSHKGKAGGITDTDITAIVCNSVISKFKEKQL